MRKIFVCSKLRGNIEENIAKAKEYCKFVISEGNMPFAPHVYFTQFLNDNIEEERNKGIQEGIKWLKDCDELWFFGERSSGMNEEIKIALKESIPVINKSEEMNKK